MSVYAEIRDIARQQAEAARSGDIECAMALLAARGRLVAAAPAASVADEPIILEVLELDREIASAIRQRMLSIRQEVLANRQGQSALAGYRGNSTRTRRVFELQA